MPTRLRVWGYRFQLMAMADDGDELTPLQLQPVEIPAAQWPQFVQSGLGEAIEKLRAEVESAQPSVVEDPVSS